MKKCIFSMVDYIEQPCIKKKIKKFQFIMNKNVIRELSSVDDVSNQIYKNLKTIKLE